MANNSLLEHSCKASSTKITNYSYFYTKADYEKRRKMHGAKRVAVFFLLIVLLPLTLILIPLYLRRNVFADVTYKVAESDIIEIRDGISSIFCSQHSLHMDSHFNAFQLRNKPEISSNRKHVRLKKSMILPDDTLEYFGFYLLKGATVHVKLCSRYTGSRLLVVRGERELQTCQLFEHNTNKIDTNMAKDHEKVQVFFEDKTKLTKINTTDNMNSINSDYLMNLENNAAEIFDEDNNSLNIALPIHFQNKSFNKFEYSASKINKSFERKYGNKLFDKGNNAIEKSIIKNGIHHDEENFFEESKILKENVYKQLFEQRDRKRRDHVYDRKYSHGGNAINFTETLESNSASSFEADLIDCYNGNILLVQDIPPSIECINIHFLENGTHGMLSKHDITLDGYYYYIFYSDNDLVRNDIHAIFDIYKPTFQYTNLSNSDDCIEVTNCTFNMTFLTNDIVIVEIPTRDGIEHEEDNIIYLRSICHPRSEIYAIFPLLVIIIILSCSSL